LATAVVTMYGRCGRIDTAREVFDGISLPDVIAWSAMLTAYSQSGHGKEALAVLAGMDVLGLKPSAITFVSVLCCCGHAGLLEDVWSCFVGMIGDHGVVPGVDHYACVVDLLGRAGRLAEAEDLMASMPFEPDFAAWTSFLDSCKSAGARTRSFAAANALVVDPSSSGPYVLLSNM
ncbi:hypothetical protein SELMODRAFT_72150, partial [Selaginella moellendorffii]